jgi:predicted AlkP superfamily phosphohydrolase/phosphomutase
LPEKQKKVLFIGIDGFDPNIMETMMGRGELPAFARLAEQGYYSRLHTVNPPQSPVVWTSIATGCSPAEHGIFDFLHSDPRTYLPYLSILRQDGFRYKPPYSVRTFWEKASEAGIPSTIIRWPVTFPPKPVQGHILAGLGVPDIRGTLGTYAFYTTDSLVDNNVDKKGKIIRINVRDNRVITELVGPIAATIKGRKEITLPLVIDISEGYITCSLSNTTLKLKEGQWSEWIPVKFSIGLMARVKGICKLYLKSIHPEFELYVTPIHVAPSSYTFPVSAPYDYAESLQEEIGPFATLGMPEETNALNDEVINEDAFLLHCDTLMNERGKMFFTELKKFNEGIMACVFDTTDRIQHMFWRFLDSTHPRYDANLAEKYGDVIPGYYRRMDSILSEVIKRTADDTLLLICSDHGFSSFRKTVHLNTWLVQNGFMSQNKNNTQCAGLFEDVQWQNTKAYAVGFNSIYINRADREKNGIVAAEDIELTKKLLIEKLSMFNDHGTKVINKVYDTKELYSGKHFLNEPDLIVSYDKAYRSSSSSAVGQIIDGQIIENNLKKWSGDHCSDAESVPGIIFSNNKIFSQEISVLDIAPTIEGYWAI